MKGISPIIASVLLIAITMSIAVVLAGFVTSYTREQTGAIPTTCIGGALFIESSDCETTTDTLTLDLRAEYVELSDFTVDTRDASGIVQSGLSMTPTQSILPGRVGTYSTSVTECDSITQFRVSTNCFNVNTDWTAV